MLTPFILIAIVAGKCRACGRQAEILGDKAKPEMNNLKPIFLQDNLTIREIILHLKNMLGWRKL